MTRVCMCTVLRIVFGEGEGEGEGDDIRTTTRGVVACATWGRVNANDGATVCSRKKSTTSAATTPPAGPKSQTGANVAAGAQQTLDANRQTAARHKHAGRSHRAVRPRRHFSHSGQTRGIGAHFPRLI